MYRELHESLKKTYSIPQFDPNAVAFLMEKFDKNGDKKIDFFEFYDLFDRLNVLHKEFLDADFKNDSNGLVDSRELQAILKRKGYDLSMELFDFIMANMSKGNRTYGLKFDKYIGVIARLDHLIGKFSRSYNGQNLSNLEKFLKEMFF